MVLAKHDENYMPKEVADALKKRGVWKEAKVADDRSGDPGLCRGNRGLRNIHIKKLSLGER